MQKYYAKYQKSIQDAVDKGFAQLLVSANESKPKSPMKVKLEMKMKETQNVIYIDNNVKMQKRVSENGKILTYAEHGGASTS